MNTDMKSVAVVVAMGGVVPDSSTALDRVEAATGVGVERVVTEGIELDTAS